VREIVRAVRPNSEWLEGVLRDKAAVLAHDHDRGDRRFVRGVPVHRRLHFDPRVLAHGPLAVAATRAASRAASFQGGDNFMFVVRGNALVIVHRDPRLGW